MDDHRPDDGGLGLLDDVFGVAVSADDGEIGDGGDGRHTQRSVVDGGLGGRAPRDERNKAENPWTHGRIVGGPGSVCVTGLLVGEKFEPVVS